MGKEFAVNTLKDGRKAIIFGKSEDSLKMFCLAMSVLTEGMIADASSAFNSRGQLAQDTSLDTTSSRRAKRGRSVLTTRKRNDKKDKELFELRNIITEDINLLSQLKYKKQTNYMYAELYEQFHKQTGYVPAKKSKIVSLDLNQPTLLNTILLDGKGTEFWVMIIEQIQQYTQEA